MKFTKIENGEYKASNGLWILLNEFDYGYPVWIVARNGRELFHTNTLSGAKAKIINKYPDNDQAGE
jgi:hypothetical protein